MKLAAGDRTLLTRQLDELARAVEELLLSGLTTASAATRETFEITFREASRLRLLRLASTLRAANEEIGRFVAKQSEFSGKRLAFFLNRAWLLARGLLRALSADDDAEWDRLLWTQPAIPIERLEVVTLGVGKKVAKGSFCAFEFRLRVVTPTRSASEEAERDAPSDPSLARRVSEGPDVPTRLVWSCVFPLKPGVEIPPEGFLQMPQKQKFKASVFLEGRTIALTNVMLTADDWGNGRVSLTDTSSVTVGSDKFSDWSRFADWSAESLLQRLQQHEPGPFDLEVELQEEVVLRDWNLAARMPEQRDGQFFYPVSAGSLAFDAVVSAGVDGQTLDKRLSDLVKAKSRPPLFGLLHFERCRFILQPLSVLSDNGPEFLTISNDKVDQAALLKTLKF